MTAESPEGTSLPTPVRRRRAAAPVEAVRPVALVGLPGSGKSTVARHLAERLGWRWVDLDERIEAVTGQSIPELFERGEEHFRTVETEVLRGVLAVPTEVVVATGGGIVGSAANRATLASRSTVVWLDVDVGVLAKRLSADATDRPLLTGTIERLSVLCGLPSVANVDDVIRAVAQVTRQQAASVAHLLRDAVPTSEADLIKLSDALLTLEAATVTATRPSSATMDSTATTTQPED